MMKLLDKFMMLSVINKVDKIKKLLMLLIINNIYFSFNNKSKVINSLS